MTNSPNSGTVFNKELRLLFEGIERLANAFLNRMFDLGPKAASRRMTWFIFLFLFTGFLLSLINYPLSLWITRVQDIFLYFFNGAYRTSYVGNPISNFILFGLQVFLDPRNIHLLPLLLAPFFISLQSAAIYLADIFELEDIAIARNFVREVALTGSNETIRISKGDLSEEHRKSPAFLIGGPGKVIVDLDSAALFERQDGTPHVIGPTGNESHGKATLEGFERFREAIDLRDQFIDLRDEAGKFSSVKGRSSDGLPITATDVRLMFSVHRAGRKPAPDEPYPYGLKAIEKLIYKAPSSVTPEVETPSSYTFAWISNMIGLVRGKLGGFMSERRLIEYLASIGAPELEKARNVEKTITEETQRLSRVDKTPPEKDIPPLPEFKSRDEITSLFSQFTDQFAANAKDRGVELHWIGIGTWRPPIEIFPDTKVIPEKHIEAWSLSKDNITNGNEDAIKNFENESILFKLMDLMRDVPIAAYQKAVNIEPHKNALRALLLAYRQQLINAAEFMQNNNETVPPNITRAIAHIDIILNLRWVGKSQPISLNE